MSERKPTRQRKMHLDGILIRLDRAGGEISEVIERTATSPLRDQMTSINLLIGDTRLAVRRIQNGEDPEVVYKDLAEKKIRVRRLGP